MSVPIEFYTVVVRETAATTLKVGSVRLRNEVRGVVEAGLVRWVCLSYGDVELIVRQLETYGLTSPGSGPDADVAVLDMMRGLLWPCSWLEVEGEASEPKKARVAPAEMPLFGGPAHAVGAPDLEASDLQPTRDGLAALLEYVRQEGRICPMPIPWNELWLLLTDGAGYWDFDLSPLILGQWVFTGDLKKQRRLEAQLEWANHLGLIWVADQFLRSLTHEEWHAPEWPNMADPGPSDHDPETGNDLE